MGYRGVASWKFENVAPWRSLPGCWFTSCPPVAGGERAGSAGSGCGAGQGPSPLGISPELGLTRRVMGQSRCCLGGHMGLIGSPGRPLPSSPHPSVAQLLRNKEHFLFIRPSSLPVSAHPKKHLLPFACPSPFAFLSVPPCSSVHSTLASLRTFRSPCFEGPQPRGKPLRLGGWS